VCHSSRDGAGSAKSVLLAGGFGFGFGRFAGPVVVVVAGAVVGAAVEAGVAVRP
jgi:hypothetical protein